MRIEIDYNIFIATIIGLLVVLILSKMNMPIKTYRIILALVSAITMPSFIPGHGEIIMLIPTGGLFAVDSFSLKGIGIIFVVINYFIAWFVINKAFVLFKNDGDGHK